MISIKKYTDTVFPIEIFYDQEKEVYWVYIDNKKDVQTNSLKEAENWIKEYY